MAGTSHPTANRRRNRFNGEPYLLILPSLLYLAVFFAWPMARGLGLAVWDSQALLRLRTEASTDSAAAGALAQGIQVDILERQGNVVSPDDLQESNIATELWFQIRGQDAEGNVV